MSGFFISLHMIKIKVVVWFRTIWLFFTCCLVCLASDLHIVVYPLHRSAETAIVYYRLSFADQGKPTSGVCLQQTYGSLPFPFSVCRKNKPKLPFSISSVSICVIPEAWRHGDGDGDRETWRHRDTETQRHGDIKRKIEAQAIFLNSFTVCSSCKRKFVVCPFVDGRNKRKMSVCKRTNGLNGLAQIWNPAPLF